MGCEEDLYAIFITVNSPSQEEERHKSYLTNDDRSDSASQMLHRRRLSASTFINVAPRFNRRKYS